MERRWVWTWARPIAAGWGALLALTYLAERPLLRLTVPWVGPRWVATASLLLGALKLAAAGWAAGRLHPRAPLRGMLAFALTLCFFSFQALLPIDVPWLARLAIDATQDARYWGALAGLAAQHLLWFGSLIAGGLLSRPPQAPLSLFGKPPR